MRAEELVGGKRYLHVWKQPPGEPHVRVSIIELQSPLAFYGDSFPPQLVIAKTVRVPAFWRGQRDINAYGNFWVANLVWPVELEERDDDDSDVLRLRDGP